MITQTNQPPEPKVNNQVQVTLEWDGEDGKSHRVTLHTYKKNMRTLINETGDITFFNLSIDGKLYTGDLIPQEAHLYILKLLEQFS